MCTEAEAEAKINELNFLILTLKILMVMEIVWECRCKGTGRRDAVVDARELGGEMPW